MAWKLEYDNEKIKKVVANIAIEYLPFGRKDTKKKWLKSLEVFCCVLLSGLYCHICISRVKKTGEALWKFVAHLITALKPSVIIV